MTFLAHESTLVENKTSHIRKKPDKILSEIFQIWGIIENAKITIFHEIGSNALINFPVPVANYWTIFSYL